MKYSLAALLAISGLVSAAPAPVAKRQSGINDGQILNYALTLEHLEATFYATYLAKFAASDFTNAGFDSSVRARIAEIGGHEQTHVAFLTTALMAANVTPTAACNYSFGVTDVKSFLATASILEGVGVSAYLGAAASIANPAYLTAAGTILTVEARHASYVRNVVGEDPFAQPFDVPLDFDQVYSLAAEFITSCPSTNPALPVKAFPGLTATPSGAATNGAQVKLTPTNASSIANVTGPIYAAWIGFPTSAFGLYNPATEMVMIPSDVEFMGQQYIVLTTSNTTVTDDTILAGPAILEVVASS